MARKIKVQFDDKTYILEYNRESIIKLMSSLSDDESEIEQAINIIYYGLWKHHANEMPEKDLIYGWVIAMGSDLKPFVEELQKSIQEILETVKGEQKQGNLKWEVVN